VRSTGWECGYRTQISGTMIDTAMAAAMDGPMAIRTLGMSCLSCAWSSRDSVLSEAREGGAVIAFARCEHEASAIIAARLQDANFRRRQESASETWNMEFPFFIRRVRIIIAMALFSACRGADDRSPAGAAAAGLTVLREATVVELFGVLPADLGESAAVVEQLRLLSISLTARSAIMWERLILSARNVLEVDAQYPDEDHIVHDPGGPDVTYGTLSTER
jgi:hypothetical protein